MCASEQCKALNLTSPLKIQTAVSEPVSHSLIAHLQKERRQKEKPTSPQIISYRGTAADIIGPDEHVFRLNWVGPSFFFIPEPQLLTCCLNVQERGVMTMQLLGKNDPSTDDSETLADRWRNYIGSYTLVSWLFCTILNIR
jgi:paired amphipathic helix protein Sin3a